MILPCLPARSVDSDMEKGSKQETNAVWCWPGDACQSVPSLGYSGSEFAVFSVFRIVNLTSWPGTGSCGSSVFTTIIPQNPTMKHHDRSHCPVGASPLPARMKSMGP